MTECGTKANPWPISVSDLDAFEKYVRPDPNKPWEVDMTADDFLRRLNREEDIGIAGEIGTAFHAAIEQAMITARQQNGALQLDHMTGVTDRIRVTFAPGDNAPRFTLKSYSVVEQDCELVMDTGAGYVQLRGAIDGLYGTVIRDIKTTKRFEASRYADSWQWRSYMAMLGEQYRKFEYLVFVLGYGKKQEAALAEGELTTVYINDFHGFPVYRYDRMEEDLQRICAEFAEYLRLIEWKPPAKRQMETF